MIEHELGPMFHVNDGRGHEIWIEGTDDVGTFRVLQHGADGVAEASIGLGWADVRLRGSGVSTGWQVRMPTDGRYPMVRRRPEDGDQA